MKHDNEYGSEHSESVLALESPNKRINRIRRFVSRIPQHAALLTLYTVSENPLLLGSWEPANIVDGTADDIEEIMEDYAREADLVEAKFSLTYLSEQNASLGTKPFSIRSKSSAGLPDAAAAIALGLDGTRDGQIMQLQRHMEGMAKMYMLAHQQQLNMAHKLVEQAMGMLNHQDDRIIKAHVRIAELEQANTELAGTYKVGEAGDDDDGGELTPLQREGLELAKQLIPKLTQAVELLMMKAAAKAA